MAFITQPSQAQDFHERLASLTKAVVEGTNQIQILLRNLHQDLATPENRSIFFSTFFPDLVKTVNIQSTLPFATDGSIRGHTRKCSAVWNNLAPMRKAFSEVFNFALRNADEHNFPIQQDLLVVSHLFLMSGPTKFWQPNNTNLRIIDSNLTFSLEFLAKEEEIVENICHRLRELGLGKLFTIADRLGSSRAPLQISIQKVADIVTTAYGFASIPLNIKRGKKFDMPHFNIRARLVNIDSVVFNKLNDKERVWLMLHEIRHGIIWSLVDNARFSRGDGSPTLYKHNSTHALVKEFPLDIARSEIGEYSRILKTQLILSDEGQSILYSRLFSERDADYFASRIVANLSTTPVDKVLQENLALLSQNLRNSDKSERKKKGLQLSDHKGLELPKDLVTAENKPLNLREAVLTSLFGNQETLENRKISKIPSKSHIHKEKSIPERDLYARLHQSLAMRAISAKFKSSREASESLAELSQLANQAMPGFNGLLAYRNRLSEVLERPGRLSRRVLNMLSIELSSLNERIEEERSWHLDLKIKKPEANISTCSEIFNQKNPKILLALDGSQMTLFDTSVELEQALQKDNLLKAAELLMSLKGLIEQGWLGQWPTLRFKEAWPDISKHITKISDKKLARLFEKHANAIVKPLLN